MADWTDLKAELNAWQDQGRTVTLWWRDDDAECESRALDRLLDQSAKADVPLALCVVPARLTSGLRRRLDRQGRVSVLQHGFAHTNHAPDGVKKAEFGPHRAEETMWAEIEEGRCVLADLASFTPIFVPPWNRMDDSLCAFLSRQGFEGVSLFGSRQTNATLPRRINSHVDVMDWRGSRVFVGEATVLDGMVGHLKARRTRQAEANEVTGLMTHHLVHDEGVWGFLDALFERTRAWDVRWLSAAEVLAA